MRSQLPRVIALACLAVLLGGVIWHQFLRPDPSLQSYQLPGQATEGTTTAPGLAAAPGPVAPGAQSQFKEVAFEIDELIQGVQEVEFDYERQRLGRNPMTPLVGPRFVRTGEADEPLLDDRVQRTRAELMARSIRLTTIVWDDVDPFAILNNEVVSTGYTFPEGVVVEAIEQSRVILRVENTLIPVNLEEP